MSTEHKNEARSFLLFYLASFVLFGVLRFCLRELVITLIVFDKKGSAVPVHTGLRFFDHRQKRTSQSRCIRDQPHSQGLSFAFSIIHDSALRVTCFVRMQDEVVLLHNWDNNYVFCSRT